MGIKILKARLSEYIRMVKSGETVLITERDEVVAELRPSNRQPLCGGGLAEWLQSLAEKGEATLASEPISTWKPPSPTKLPAGVTLKDILEGLRSED